MGNLPSSDDAIFRTLIAANNSPFSESFKSCPTGLDFSQNLANPLTGLANKKGGHFGDRWISHDSPKIVRHRSARPYFEL